MTQDLQVKKQPVPATVFLGDGSTLSGTIFLSPVGPSQHGRETVHELMEEPEAMMPFHAQSERFLLVGKETIVAIRILSGEAPTRAGNSGRRRCDSPRRIPVQRTGRDRAR